MPVSLLTVSSYHSLGLLLAELTTRQLIAKRGQWELPRVPEDCPQVGQGSTALIIACMRWF